MVFGHVRNLLVTGLVALIPVGITLFALRFLYGAVTGLVAPLLAPFITEVPLWARVVLTAGAAAMLLVAVGWVATNVVGRRLIGGFERIVLRIPIVRVIYQAAKQVVDAFRMTKPGFKSVVMVEFPRPGMRAVGFLTNTLVDREGLTWNTVFIPTTPNPTTGFMQVIPAADVVHLGWSVETAIKTIMSLGALAPEGFEAEGAKFPEKA